MTAWASTVTDLLRVGRCADVVANGAGSLSDLQHRPAMYGIRCQLRGLMCRKHRASDPGPPVRR